MACSKKDYVAVAEEVRKARQIAMSLPAVSSDSQQWQVQGIEDLARRLALYFGSQSQAFDKARFLKACGIGEQPKPDPKEVEKAARRPLRTRNPRADLAMKYAYFDRFEFAMTLEQALSAAHQGECSEDVEALSRVPEIRSQLDALDPEQVRRELKGWGAWEAEELTDHEDNLQRILWLAACNIREEEQHENPA